jgi:two-component system, sensor histidine kinase RpfC
MVAGVLWTIFGQGMRFGLRTLVEATTVNILGFAIVLAVSPYWQERSLFAASIFLALVALPTYAGILSAPTCPDTYSTA